MNVCWTCLLITQTGSEDNKNRNKKVNHNKTRDEVTGTVDKLKYHDRSGSWTWQKSSLTCWCHGSIFCYTPLYLSYKVYILEFLPVFLTSTYISTCTHDCRPVQCSKTIINVVDGIAVIGNVGLQGGGGLPGCDVDDFSRNANTPFRTTMQRWSVWPTSNSCGSTSRRTSPGRLTAPVGLRRLTSASIRPDGAELSCDGFRRLDRPPVHHRANHVMSQFTV